MLRSLLLTISLIALALLGGSLPAEASACPHVDWGSLEKANLVQGSDTITGVRAGQDGCFDRLVFDVRGTRPGYDVKYVNVVTDVAAGRPLNVPGGARISIAVFDNAANSRTPNVTGFPTFRSVVYGGSFEAVTIYGLGVRARLPFRVFTLPNPSRLVIDVARTW